MSSGKMMIVDGEARDLGEIDAEQGVQVEGTFETSLAKAFEAKFRLYAKRPCIGWRDGGEFCWMSYGKFFEHSRQLGNALSATLAPGTFVGICGANSLGWFTADFGCLWAGLTSIPLSDNWQPNVLHHVLEKCEVAAVFCDAEFLPKLQASDLELRVILLDKPGCAWAKSSNGKIQDVVQLEDFTSSKEWPEQPVVARGPEAIHTIFHTSGTTGMPKGVVYTDSKWRSNMVSYSGLNIGYSYMPLAFITDRHTVYTNIWNGGRAGIRSIGDSELIFQDLTLVQPTVLKGVPSFFEAVKATAQYMSDRALMLLGGRAATLICGAGALDEQTAEWFRTCEVHGKKVVFLEMYGGTECGNIAMNRKIHPHVEYKLRQFADFQIEKGENGKDQGTGELLVKTGASMFTEYYKDSERTMKAFTEDGFYQIGDLVCITGDHIDVIGRANTSIKLGNGKWVMPESLENMFRSELTHVRQVWIYGDSQHEYLIGVVDTESKDDEASFLKQLNDIASQNGRAPYERISAIILAREPFSQKAGTLNGTGKLDRKILRRLYKDDIDEAMHDLDEKAADMAFDAMDPNLSFTSQGGNSLQANRLAALYLKLGLPISRAAQLLLKEATTVSEAKAALQHRNPKVDSEWDVLEDVKLAERSPHAEGAVLLTGATGFLGRFILAELLEAGHTVVCLQRDKDIVTARKRLHGALGEISRFKAAWMPRILIHLSSLQSPLNLEEYTIATVIHAAAMVNLKAGYGYHRAANVLGTYHVVHFAAQAGARLIFVSTTDTYKNMEQAIACAPEPVEEVLVDDRHGYAQSKAVSEAHIAAAVKKGLSACTVRLGMVAGDTQTGFCTPTDFNLRLIIGFAHCKAFPETDDKHTLVHSVPVDVAAAAIVNLAGSSVVGAANLVSGAPMLRMRELREQLVRFGGHFADLPVVPFSKWKEVAKAEAQLSAWPVMSWVDGMAEFPQFNQRTPPLTADWASSTTLKRLQRGMDEDCLHKMLGYCFALEGDLSHSGVYGFRVTGKTAVAVGKLLRSVRP
eukprot:TRINITY_DN17648_c0_g1_i3.p1 TRINITY_DN17648_c0_g1~~TRINITY_DN17648_c0_g1_i3.p1  ORF type:complete len:1030 (+),score=208.22 TRINITY_DN17648_c0_g1_i3:85-3174(+)